MHFFHQYYLDYVTFCILYKEKNVKMILTRVITLQSFKTSSADISALENAYAPEIRVKASFLTPNEIADFFSNFRKLPIISELALSSVIPF